MTTATFYSAVDMTYASTWYGYVTSYGSSHLTISNYSGSIGTYYGSFSYSGNNVYGTLTGYDAYADYTLVARVRGGSVDAHTAQNLVNSGNAYGLLKLAFSGSDTVNGSAYGDKLAGYSGNDKLYGNDGNDYLYGHDGDDSLFGGAGIDTLLGSIGLDLLRGGYGADRLFGGPDSDKDVFDFNSVTESLTSPTGRDRIYDFTTRIDDIDLSTIDANSRVGGDQVFKFGGTTRTANGVWYEKSGADLLVHADINGDKVSDMDIQIVGVSKLVATDFVL